MELLTYRRDGNHFFHTHSEKHTRDVCAGFFFKLKDSLLVILYHCELAFKYIDESATSTVAVADSIIHSCAFLRQKLSKSTETLVGGQFMKAFLPIYINKNE